MTATLADARRDAIEAGCRPWVVRAGWIIDRQVDNARVHAATAITATLIATPDGRPTAARANRNRSLMAANSRLDELAIALAGPSVRSLEGLIRDAWADAYKESRRYWMTELGPDFCRTVSYPKAELTAVRGLVLGGSDARTRVLAATDPARRRLRSLVVAYASPAVADRDRSGSLRAWQVATTKVVAMAARNAIVTGAFRADILAGRAVIRPDLLHDDPTISGA